MADLDAEAMHDRLMHAADLGAEPILELEFNQTLCWWHRRNNSVRHGV